MPARSFTVDLNPEVLRWARESAGYSLDQVADRVADAKKDLAAWEAGRKQPNWSALKKLAAVYKRPVAALLLPAPPDEPPKPPDFRTLPVAKKGLSPKTCFAIRNARWLVSIAADLQQQLGIEPEFQVAGLRSSVNPESLAQRYRNRLGISVAEQGQWRDLYQALHHWRLAIEGQGIFVFQSKMPREEVLGFSLSERGRPAIVLNQSDAVSARIFTLFHEYAHLLLANPGICLPEERAASRSPGIETFCNRFAAALLIPRDDVAAHIPSSLDERAFVSLARRYSVSRYVVLGRLRTLGAISPQTYQQMAQRWKSQAGPNAGSQKKQGGGPSAVVRCLSERGRPFVSLVVQAASREVI